MRPLVSLLWLVVAAAAADLPVREVVLYKHGVGYFERAGDLSPGETARLDFKAEDMNDVLKSLVIAEANGGKVGGVRYDASEPLEKRLQDFPFAVGAQTTLAAVLDQMKGARLEMRVGLETVAGTIVSARVVKSSEKDPEREVAVLITDSGDIRSFDLGAATSVKLSDPKLQSLLKDYLAVVSGARSKDRRSVFIDSTGTGTRQLVASYMTPAPVWKSSYRLIFGTEPQPMLEGWAIVDNTSGEDWENVKLSVVSGRPISFITQLYEPRYVQRPTAELAENRAVAPQVFQGSMGSVTGSLAAVPPAAAPRQQAAAMGGFGGGGGARKDALAKASEALSDYSSVASTAEGQDAGELFEYSFANPITVKKGESAMLPFLQQRLNTRKLLIYSDNMNLHPMNAAEITNTTGKTLDGGPITVYDAGVYAGEALVETLKAADKRLIAYGVDLGTRISTAWDSSRDVVREIHLRRGALTMRTAAQETKTYTIKNVDAQPKTLVIEHPQRPGYKLLNQKPSEQTANAYRFEVKMTASGTETFAVQEERVYDSSYTVTSFTPDVLVTYVQNKNLSETARKQLGEILARKRQIADSEAERHRVETQVNNIVRDQDRLRQNINSLNHVAGQEGQVQKYARQLADQEGQLATLRDRQSDLEHKNAALQSELNSLIEKMEF